MYETCLFLEEPPPELVEKSEISQPFYYMDMKVAIPVLGTFLAVSVVVCAILVCLKRSKKKIKKIPCFLLSTRGLAMCFRTGQRSAKLEGRVRPKDHGEPKILRDHTQSGPDEFGKNPR